MTKTAFSPAVYAVEKSKAAGATNTTRPLTRSTYRGGATMADNSSNVCGIDSAIKNPLNWTHIHAAVAPLVSQIIAAREVVK